MNSCMMLFLQDGNHVDYVSISTFALERNEGEANEDLNQTLISLQDGQQEH